MNPTEKLRRLLDERGVEYGTDDAKTVKATRWKFGENGSAMFTEYDDEECAFVTSGCTWTPEQAIEGTLGRPKVKKVRGMTYDHAGGEVYFLACSGCGEWIDGDLNCIGEFDGPKFCPNCGGEFDGPKLCSKCGRLADLEYGDLCAECYEGGAE